MNKQEMTNLIIQDAQNTEYTRNGHIPLFSFSSSSRLIIIGQAPGVRAQESQIPWDDKSGDRLRDWLGITKEQFHDDSLVALVPMDFYYPGKGKTGDLPPRKGFAEKWHPLILDQIKGKPFVILIGQYAQKYYLQGLQEKNLTETVRSYEKYLGRGFFPLPHPSPRNNIWMKKNPWFEEEIVPALQEVIRKYVK